MISAVMLYLLMVAHSAACQTRSTAFLLKVYEYVVDVSLGLMVFLTQNSEVEDLFCGAASHSKARLFLCDDVFGLRFQSVQDDL